MFRLSNKLPSGKNTKHQWYIKVKQQFPSICATLHKIITNYITLTTEFIDQHPGCDLIEVFKRKT